MAVSTLVCSFLMMGAPFAKTILEFSSEGTMSKYAKLEHYGAIQNAVVTKKTPAANQWLSIVFDEGQSDRELRQTVSEEPSAAFESKAMLTNPASPVMKDLPGTCVWQ